MVKRLMSDEGEEKRKLDWKDYIAIIIAMLTTTLLPVVIFIIFLLIVTMVVSHIF